MSCNCPRRLSWGDYHFRSSRVLLRRPKGQPSGAYVYYGRSHLAAPSPCYGASKPQRSVNHFVIGTNVTQWPIHTANERQVNALPTVRYTAPTLTHALAPIIL